MVPALNGSKIIHSKGKLNLETMKKKTSIFLTLAAAMAIGTTGLKANTNIYNRTNDHRIVVVHKDPGLNPIEIKRLKNLYERYLRIVRAAAEDGVITDAERAMIQRARHAYLSFKRKSRLD